MNDSSALSPERVRHSKADDPFFDDDRFTPTVEVDDPMPRPPSQNDGPSSIETFIMMPLHMISFIVSLHFVDAKYRSWRVWQHASRKLSFWSWSTPEPYQEPQDATWNVAPSVEPTSTSSWHMHGKVRKLARMEIGDALELRGQVLAFGAFWLAIFTCCAAGLVKFVYAWLT